MEQVELKGEVREAIGKTASRRQRREGLIPCVVYGLGKDSVAVALPRPTVEAMLRSGKKMVDLQVGGTNEAAIIKEMQFHPVTDRILHIDFTRIDIHKEVSLEVSIVLKGRAKGLEEHGIMDHLMHSIEVTCLPTNIPDELLLDVSELEIGDSHTVAQLQLPQGVTVSADPEETIVIIHPPMAEEEETVEEEEEGPSTPEIITAAAEDDEAQGEAAESSGDKSE